MSLPDRKLIRLRGYDYSRNGSYFITIRIKSSSKFLSKIINNQLILSPFGEIVKDTWYEIPAHFPTFNLDEFIVMPTHIHGLIHIKNSQNQKPRSLSDMVKSFKFITRKRIGKINNGEIFTWRKSFNDTIIRNDIELSIIRKYIRENPLQIK